MVVDQKGRDSASLLSYCASSSISLVTVCVTGQGCPLTHTVTAGQTKTHASEMHVHKTKANTLPAQTPAKCERVCVCVSVCERDK